jgi:signal transduction histidine kinase
VFEPFRQGADPLTRKVGGAGLGLHLVERYAELLGGTIDATSKPGEGSVFTVHLPRRLRTLAGSHP